MTAYKLVNKSCFINVSARLDPIEGYRGEEGPPPKLLSSRGFRGFRGSRPPLHTFSVMLVLLFGLRRTLQLIIEQSKEVICLAKTDDVCIEVK